MAQIFISHSAKDRKPIEFLNQAFASSKVQAKYEEIDAIVSGKRTADQIKWDIAQSNAVMVVLGPHAEQLKHTRDWMVWESGNAAAANKDVWVLEAAEDAPRLSVVMPKVRHYVCFEYQDQWLAYLRQIVMSYDDSHVLPAGVAGAGLGSAFGPGGAIIGGLPELPLGLQYPCWDKFVAMSGMQCPNRVRFASASLTIAYRVMKENRPSVRTKRDH